MTDLESQLMNSLHFTADDLAANRKGKMTVGQQVRLGRMRLQFALWSFLWTLLFLFCVGYGVPHFDELLHSPSRAFSGLVTIALLSFVCAIYYAVRWYRLGIDLRNEYTAQINGVASLRERIPERTVFGVVRHNNWFITVGYRIHINGFDFELARNLWLYLDETNRCSRFRAYYLPATQILIALECAD